MQTANQPNHKSSTTHLTRTVLKPGFKVKDHSGKIAATVLGKRIVRGMFTRLSQGFYRLQCATCSKEFICHSRDIRRRSIVSMGCAECRSKKKHQRKPRTPGFRSRPGAPEYANSRFGRLQTRQWTDNGWECQCSTCGSVLYVRRSRALTSVGNTACPGPAACGAFGVISAR